MDCKKIETFIKDYYKDFSRVRLTKWNYEDGCVLIAAMQLYEATGDDLYKDFVVKYISEYVNEDGSIKFYKKEDYNLDNIAPGRAIIFAYEQTGEERFKKAADLLRLQLTEHPRTAEGNFWHKQIYPNQVWLDGLFMAQPFYIAYETKYNKKEKYNDTVSQYKNVRKYMMDEEKGIHYHGYDASKEIFWANKETGCSANFWLRAIGWYEVSMVEVLSEMDKAVYEHYAAIMDLYRESINGVLRYQDDKTKMFYQVVDHPEVEGNYIETSGSAMIAMSILKACRLKAVLAEKYWAKGVEILNAIIDQKLVYEDGVLVLKDNCKVAGLGPRVNNRDGSIEYYLSEPIGNDDGKGVAALFMAYAQYLMGTKEQIV